MSTVAITCPECGVWLRVAVQPSQVQVLQNHLEVQFDRQFVAHKCKEK